MHAPQGSAALINPRPAVPANTRGEPRHAARFFPLRTCDFGEPLTADIVDGMILGSMLASEQHTRGGISACVCMFQKVRHIVISAYLGVMKVM
jgi:hypothetical protein